jgi:hypothetical protein
LSAADGRTRGGNLPQVLIQQVRALDWALTD